MKFFIPVISMVIILGCSNGPSEITLKKSKTEKITYQFSDKYGYAVHATRRMESNDTKRTESEDVTYVIQLNRIGKIMGIYKYSIWRSNKAEISSGGVDDPPMLYLVSDTTDTLMGAKLFGYAIEGYYNNSQRNRIEANNHIGKDFPLLPGEKEMFEEIKALMKERKLPFELDSAQHVFWFKYDL